MVWLAYAVSAEEHGVGRFGSIVDGTSKGRRAGAKGCGESTEEPTRENLRTVINKLVRNKTGVTDELIDAN